MRVHIRHVLFAAFVAVAAFQGVASLIRARSALRDDLVGLTREELRRELRLLQGELDGSEVATPDSLVGALSARTRQRVTLVDSAGTVLADSHVPPAEIPLLQNHRNRPEVAAALEGRIEVAERSSTTVGGRLVYGAAPVRLDDRAVVLRLAADLSAVDRTLDELGETLGAALFLAILLALGVAYLLSRALSRPLGVLSDRARAIASGDLDARVPRTSRLVELDDLGTALNRLADELQQRLGELGRERDQMQTLLDALGEGVVALTGDARVLRANAAARDLLDLPAPALYAPVGSLVRHPELRELLEEAVIRPYRAREVQLAQRHLLVSARPLADGGAVITLLDVSEVRRLERVRRDFVANASHELKTPLTSVRGFAETLLEDDPPEELRRRFLRSIRDNTVRLQGLVDDLLDLSRLESGGWVARREAVDVAEVARSAWRELEARAEAKDLRFGVEGEGVALADEQGLSQVLRNLLENSVQYTPEGGEVTVRIEPREERVLVAVEDTGIGIPSSSLPRIFERFYRADPARSRKEGGTGLGLAIVKHLVEAMGGRVEAVSALGKGTTVRVLLPRPDAGE